MLVTCAVSSSNWRHLRSSQADHRSTRLTDCSALHGRRILCHIQRANVPRVCLVAVLSRDKIEREIRSPAAGCQADSLMFTL